ncbi:MAG: polyphosphate--glucose phosphotransferase [Saprospiraceae bacterium]|jgi:polyphosphate glucokinase
MNEENVFGIDIGGTGIKGAIVNVTTGELVTERNKLLTPKPAVPGAIAETCVELLKQSNWSGPIGCGFPSIVKNGVLLSAANIDESNIGVNFRQLLEEKSGCPVTLVNDADAAGYAEMKFGAGKGKMGLVILITIGSGLGSAMFYNGVLIPNSELGHIYLKDKEAEKYASNLARKKFDLSWKQWGKRFSLYLNHINRIFSPDLIILGGGVSKEYEIFKKFLKIDAVEVLPAKMQNAAGTIGAALSVKGLH